MNTNIRLAKFLVGRDAYELSKSPSLM